MVVQQFTSTIVLNVLAFISMVTALDNGLARTPPMGWLTWQRYRCTTDCKTYPDGCISESLIKRTADCLVNEGFLHKGYEYITIDDCWLAKTRDSNGRLQPDPQRFPNGIKALADYVHSKNLKFGIYEDFGTETCAGFPGSEFYMQLDAMTFADWGVDLLKFDGCHSDVKDSVYGYPAMTQYLNKTGRSILYSCEWPLYDWQQKAHIKTNYSAVRNTCNMWRNFLDINDSWESVSSVINHYAKYENNLRSFAGPGGWNDPDMLVIGNFGLSHDQERVQMAMWAIFAAPLIISADVCHMRPSSKALLQNERLIRINQDTMGTQGSLVMTTNENIQIWSKPILPRGSQAVAFVNIQEGGSPMRVKKRCSDLGLTNEDGYNITETFDNQYMGQYKPGDLLTVNVNPTGVFMMNAVALNC